MNSPYRLHPASSQKPVRPAIDAGRAGPSKLELLLAYEAAIRAGRDVDQIILHAVNDTRDICNFLQACFLRRSRNGRFRVEAVSSLSGVDRNSPFVRWIEKLCNQQFDDAKTQAQVFSISAEDSQSGGNGMVYPFRHFAGLPLCDRKGDGFGLLLFSRDKPFDDAILVIGQRVASATSHAICALTPPGRLKAFSLPAKWLAALGILAFLALFIPVPMTALAPVEVVADKAVVVASPLDGVIDEIVPDPSADVKKGDVLFRLDDTSLRSEMDVSERKLLVAEAKLATATQAAFGETQARREVAIAEAEANLARAERDFVASRLAQIEVLADRDGVVIYTDRKDWIGKPVATGERIMEIADPAQTAFQVLLPSSDAIALKHKSAVRVFLDADPLNSLDATVSEAGYLAEEREGGIMSYRLIAHASDQARQEGQTTPRIGLRGTAQVRGSYVFLGFYLLRRPISALRQSLGW